MIGAKSVPPLPNRKLTPREARSARYAPATDCILCCILPLLGAHAVAPIWTVVTPHPGFICAARTNSVGCRLKLTELTSACSLGQNPVRKRLIKMKGRIWRFAVGLWLGCQSRRAVLCGVKQA